MIWSGLVLWRVNHRRLFYAESIFILINSSISNNAIQQNYIFCLQTVKYRNSSISNNSV